MARDLDIKVGDKVMVSGNAAHQDYIAIVEGESSKYWKVRGTLYDKESGRQRGGGTWTSTYIKVPTEEEIKRIERANKVAFVFRFFHDYENVKNLSDDVLDSIIGFVKK
jgi:hypothetical protein